MAIGGKREGSGRKSTWNHTPTKMMGRLPAIFESQIFEYARKLDSESESGATDQVAALREHMDAVLLSLRPSERKAAGKLFKKLLERYQNGDS